MVTQQTLNRFWKKVNKDGRRTIATPCWEWIGGKSEWGYGHFWFHGRTVKAHRFAYEQEHGPVSTQLLVCHKCDNPDCVRPEHMFVGTSEENSNDCAKKGRVQSRLTPDQVRGARRLARKHGDVTVIAMLLRVTPSTVLAAIKGKTWKHVRA